MGWRARAGGCCSLVQHSVRSFTVWTPPCTASARACSGHGRHPWHAAAAPTSQSLDHHAKAVKAVTAMHAGGRSLLLVALLAQLSVRAGSLLDHGLHVKISCSADPLASCHVSAVPDDEPSRDQPPGKSSR